MLTTIKTHFTCPSKVTINGYTQSLDNSTAHRNSTEPSPWMDLAHVQLCALRPCVGAEMRSYTHGRLSRDTGVVPNSRRSTRSVITDTLVPRTALKHGQPAGATKARDPTPVSCDPLIGANGAGRNEPLKGGSQTGAEQAGALEPVALRPTAAAAAATESLQSYRSLVTYPRAGQDVSVMPGWVEGERRRREGGGIVGADHSRVQHGVRRK